MEPKNGDYQAGGVKRNIEKIPVVSKRRCKESEKSTRCNILGCLYNGGNWMQRLCLRLYT